MSDVIFYTTEHGTTKVDLHLDNKAAVNQQLTVQIDGERKVSRERREP